jgi:hypothetical protein
MRHCPNCGKGLGPRTVLGPGFTKGGPVICHYCGATISLPWKRHPQIGVAGLGLGMLSSALVKKSMLGIENTLLFYVTLVCAVLI